MQAKITKKGNFLHNQIRKKIPMLWKKISAFVKYFPHLQIFPTPIKAYIYINQERFDAWN